MKRNFKRTLAALIAATTLTVGMSGMSANASSVGSGNKTVYETSTVTVKINGDIDLSWYSPAGGVNVYTVTATTNITGYESGKSWTLHTGIDLLNYPSGSLRQNEVVDGSSKSKPVSASVTGGYSYGNQARAYTSHEVRGSYSGVLYITSSVMNV